MIVKESIKEDFTSFSKRRHGIKTRKHYILSRQASTQPNLLNLNLFFPRRWRRPRSRLSPFSLPPRPGYLKVPNVHTAAEVFSETLVEACKKAGLKVQRNKTKAMSQNNCFDLECETEKENLKSLGEQISQEPNIIPS